MATHGSIGGYEESEEDWDSYIERVTGYFDANDIKAEKQVSTLISMMGAKTYKLLKSLMYPDQPKAKSLANITAVLSAHISPKPTEIAERFRFHTRHQGQTESVADYVAALKTLAQNCNFDTFLQQALRDRLVCGLKTNAIQTKLLSVKDLTFKIAVETALAMETVSKDTEELKQSRPVNKVYGPRGRGRGKGGNTRLPDNPHKRTCGRCGGNSHDSDDCRFRSETCHACGRKGHIQRVCRSRNDRKEKGPKTGGRKKKVHSTGAEDEQEGSDFEDCYHIRVHSVNGSGHDPMWVNLQFNDQHLKMELDTGAAISLLPYKVYQKQFSDVPLHHSSVKLRMYSGHHIAVTGSITCTAKYGTQEKRLTAYVVETNEPPLLGREWLRHLKLDWRSIKRVQKLSPITEQLSDLLEGYSEGLFKEGIGTIKGVKARITLKDGAQPRFFKARTVPYALRPKVESELERLVTEGVLEKIDDSEWGTPIVPVVKGDGSVRICGDFKVTLNPVIQNDKYPIPRIEDIYANLAGGQKFSKLDLAHAYLQIPMDEASREYVTITTHKGLFRYRRLPFGIYTASGIFQRAIDTTLQGLEGVQVYADDLLVTGKDDQEHWSNLKKVLDRLQAAGLRVKKEKCKFMQPSVTYLGHKIDASGLHATGPKVEAVLNAPCPLDVSQLRSFLGLLNYYGRFLPNLSSVIHPLNALLGNREWEWSRKHEQAFDEAKKMLASAKVLTHYDPAKPMKLAADASSYGIGAVISHTLPDGTERPIAFASRSLSESERNYPQLEKEALSLIYGVKKFFAYLYGRRFTLITDHKPLTTILHPHKSTPTLAAARLQRWALFLSGMDYDIEFRKTEEHCNADGLSRLPLSVGPAKQEDPCASFQIHYMDTFPVSSQQIATHTRRDPILSKAFDLTTRGWGNRCNDAELQPLFGKKDELTVLHNCLMWGLRVIIPGKLRSPVLQELHEGHLGIVKMKAIARSYCWWPGLDADIEVMAKGCSG
jgi:hypothetical protein